MSNIKFDMKNIDEKFEMKLSLGKRKWQKNCPILKNHSQTITQIYHRRDGKTMMEPFDLKGYIMSRIHIKLTLLFLLVGLVAPAIGIGYFYLIANSSLIQNSELFRQQQMLLNAAALLIIILIAVNTMIIGFFISRSFSKPIRELYIAAQELEKGNFKIRIKRQINIQVNFFYFNFVFF
jgi:methyl-accepting chemotaxis protein